MMAIPANDSPLSFRPAVIAPTYNNAPMLMSVLNRLEPAGLPVFVIDDGSTDETPAILGRWQQNRHNRYIRSHPRNLGKAAALRSGFDAARASGFTHAISIDTDGQLAPEDVPRLVAAAAANPATLILGARDERAAEYPARSRLGRRVSNLLVRWECGRRVEDSQCGLRAYPLHLVAAVQCRAEHFGFETEIIVRVAWEGAAVTSLAVACRYFPVGQRISHFRPWRDSFRAVAMHTRLISDAMKRRSHGPRRWQDDEQCEMRPLVQVSGATE
jgi:glycosyltransferase involved in cell wall biosynthesis